MLQQTQGFETREGYDHGNDVQTKEPAGSLTGSATATAETASGATGRAAQAANRQPSAPHAQPEKPDGFPGNFLELLALRQHERPR